ncbi:MAG TPA: DUF4394 domain-containing protein, partial [Tepidisphaeraceae bacterium]|nr:DUF4394 domain-containing protein [Tepidisphaeraceae bacterium]
MAEFLGRRSSAGAVVSRFVERLEDRCLLSTSVFGLTVDNRLVQFDADNPSVTSNPLPVTGLPQDDVRVVGIDVRPADGQLYALATNATIYRINPSTGAATAIGPAFTGVFNGPGYDLDVDPVSDRIRVVTNGGNNFIVNPDTGTVTTQTAPAYAAGDPRAGTASNVSGIGYSNNFVGATGTTLYGIDTGTDSLVRVGDPDAAQTTAASGQLHTIGALGIDVQSAGVDVGNEAGGGVVYAAVNFSQDPVTRLYRIDPTSGAATLVGAIGSGIQISEIAVFPRAVQFQVASASVAENGNAVTLTVTRVNGSSGPATVSFATQDDSAVA